MRNLSTLFSNSESGFIKTLNLTKKQKEAVQTAKVIIREHLRTGIPNRAKLFNLGEISPRFLSQGSYVYKTRNKPCTNPPQQIDHDLGCYLPLSYIENTNNPSVAANDFFKIVDGLLKEVVINENWKSVDTSKATCSRVIVNNEIHIDVPLYSIPDHEFNTITEKAKSMDFAGADIRSLQDWELVKNNVLLAHRIDDWIISDPRKLNDYFINIFDIKGEQLRRVCRYLKAWRDYHWLNGGPSSIYLMVLADSIFKMQFDKRDDLALLNVLQNIPLKLKFPVVNPAENDEHIRISEEDFNKLLSLAEGFADDLNQAIYNEIDSGKACSLIQKHLGDRFPYDSTIPFNSEQIRYHVQSKPIGTDYEYRDPESRGRAG